MGRRGNAEKFLFLFLSFPSLPALLTHYHLPLGLSCSLPVSQLLSYSALWEKKESLWWASPAWLCIILVLFCVSSHFFKRTFTQFQVTVWDWPRLQDQRRRWLLLTKFLVCGSCAWKGEGGKTLYNARWQWCWTKNLQNTPNIPYIVFLWKTLYSHSVSLRPGV